MAPLRNALIAKGMIFGPAHGDTVFTVPLFDALMQRVMPQLRGDEAPCFVAIWKSETVRPDVKRQSSSPLPAASSRAVALRYASRPLSRDQYASKAGRFSIRSKWSPQRMCEPT